MRIPFSGAGPPASVENVGSGPRPGDRHLTTLVLGDRDLIRALGGCLIRGVGGRLGRHVVGRLRGHAVFGFGSLARVGQRLLISRDRFGV